MIVSDLAVMQVTDDGLVLLETAEGVTKEEAIAKTAAKLIISPDFKEQTY
jgi:3-oxoacid CoA-transferase subunit B